MNVRKNEQENEQRCEGTSFPGGGECNGVTCYRRNQDFRERNFLTRKLRNCGNHESESELSSD